MKVVFLGTPEFAINILEAIIKSSHEVVAIVTIPDKTGGRGNALIFSPVKEFAEKVGIKVYQFENINLETDMLKKMGAEVGVTAAYGQILKENTIKVFKYGIINVHASILPKYRGASPVQCALLKGEKEIGVTIMETVLAIDAGDILNIKRVQLTGTENAEECLNKLSILGGDALVETLDNIDKGEILKIPQNHAEATFCKKIVKEDGEINFSETSTEILNKLRAFSPWPSVFCMTKYGRIKILRATSASCDSSAMQMGKVYRIDRDKIVVSCKKGCLEISKLQLEGSKPMSVRDFLLGRPFSEGESFIAAQD